MSHVWHKRILFLVVAALLVGGAGCKKLAKVRDIHQELAIDRRAELVVMPLASTASLCNVQFDEGELQGAREYFTESIRENLNYSLSKQIKVIHPKALSQFLRKQGISEKVHFDKRESMKIARMMQAEIVCFGHVKVDPVYENSLTEKAKRYDLDFEVYFFDVTSDDRLATIRCAGKRKNVIHTVPWLVKHLKFYPPLKPPAKPVPKRPKKEKKAPEKTASKQ